MCVCMHACVCASSRVSGHTYLMQDRMENRMAMTYVMENSGMTSFYVGLKTPPVQKVM